MTPSSVLELIDRAYTENWKELDLSKKKLTEVPLEIGWLTQLETLKLSFNRLIVIPDVIAQLSNLTALSLGFNRLTVIPDVIAHYTPGLNLFVTVTAILLAFVVGIIFILRTTGIIDNSTFQGTLDGFWKAVSLQKGQDPEEKHDRHLPPDENK